MNNETTITVRYRALDGATKKATYKTLKGARKFAHKWVGERPEVGTYYAVCANGIGRVTWEGCTEADLFPAAVAEEEWSWEAEQDAERAAEGAAERAEWDRLNPVEERTCGCCGRALWWHPAGQMTCDNACSFG